MITGLCVIASWWGKVRRLQSLPAMTPSPAPLRFVARPGIHIHSVLNIFCCDDPGLVSSLNKNAGFTDKSHLKAEANSCLKVS